VPLHTTDDPALRFENLGTVAGSHRYSHRSSRREVQRTAGTFLGGGFRFGKATGDRRARQTAREVPQREEDLRKRANDAEDDSKALHHYARGRKAAGKRSHPPRAFGAGT